MTQIASTQNEIIYAAIQPDADTFVMPTSSGTIPLTESPTFTQDPDIVDNQEMRDSYSAEPGVCVCNKAGEFDLSMNFKVSGTPGTLSPLHPFLLSAWGNHTVTPATDVTYTHTKSGDEFVYLSIVYKKTFEISYIIGARVKKSTLKVSKRQIQGISFSGNFKKMVTAGTATLDSAIDGTSSAVTEIPLAEAEGYNKFEIGAFIVVGADDNAGQGHKITAINDSTNVLTITPGVTTAVAGGAKITGFTPVSSFAGYNTSSSVSYIDLNTGSGVRRINLTETSFNLENGVKPIEDIMSDDPNGIIDFAEDKRKVTFTIQRYFTLDGGIDARALIKKETSIPVTTTIGTEAGRIIQLVLTNARVLKSKESGKPEKKIDIDLQAYPTTAGDDESALVLK
jgi:hypothetical protein